MKQYFEGSVGNFAGESEKAICLTRCGSAFGYHDSLMWIPKSICIIGEPNENGWRKLAVPVWFLRKNNLKELQFREINGGSELVQY